MTPQERHIALPISLALKREISRLAPSSTPARPRPVNPRYSYEEDGIIRQMHKEGKSLLEIAAALGRDKKSVRTHARAFLRIEFPLLKSGGGKKGETLPDWRRERIAEGLRRANAKREGTAEVG